MSSDHDLKAEYIIELRDTLRAMRRCPGVHTTDQVRGMTFSDLIDLALGEAEHSDDDGAEVREVSSQLKPQAETKTESVNG